MIAKQPKQKYSLRSLQWYDLIDLVDVGLDKYDCERWMLISTRLSEPELNELLLAVLPTDLDFKINRMANEDSQFEVEVKPCLF